MEHWITLRAAEIIGRNAAESLGLLAFAGAVTATLRWPKANRKDFLLSFILFLLGTAITQLPVYLGGMISWGLDMILISDLGRIIQVIAAALFIRASLRDECGPWGWLLIVSTVFFLTWLI